MLTIHETWQKRISFSGIIIYVNNSPISWYSKRKNTVEASSFGSEFVAIRISTEMIESLSYNLRCFGIPVEGPEEVFFDNISVVKNPSILTSVLNKRYNAILCHRVREDQAADILQVGWVTVEFNLEELFTKTTMPCNTRHNFIYSIISNTASPIVDVEKV